MTDETEAEIKSAIEAEADELYLAYVIYRECGKANQYKRYLMEMFTGAGEDDIDELVSQTEHRYEATHRTVIH
jgi:hypothetical protein